MNVYSVILDTYRTMNVSIGDREGNFLYRHIYSELKNEDTLKNDIIKELLMHLDDKCVVYCPLSLGDHVDHMYL